MPSSKLLIQQLQRKVWFYFNFVTVVGVLMVFLVRLSPVLPFNILNYALSLTGISFPGYVYGSWVGMAPGTFMYIFIPWAGVHALNAQGGANLVKNILVVCIRRCVGSFPSVRSGHIGNHYYCCICNGFGQARDWPRAYLTERTKKGRKKGQKGHRKCCNWRIAVKENKFGLWSVRNKMEDVQECYICMDEEDVLVMACGHVLHEDCAKGQLGVLRILNRLNQEDTGQTRRQVQHYPCFVWLL